MIEQIMPKINKSIEDAINTNEELYEYRKSQIIEITGVINNLRKIAALSNKTNLRTASKPVKDLAKADT